MSFLIPRTPKRPQFEHITKCLVSSDRTEVVLIFFKRRNARSLQENLRTSGIIADVASLRRHGAHDFDFLIGNWKAHVWRLPDRLVGSNKWIEYTGYSNHKKVFDTNANLEDFNVTSVDGALHIKAQTLRMYDPVSHQWSIYGLDLDNGQLAMPPEVGVFTGNRGEFFDQEDWKGRMIIVRYEWINVSPTRARMMQSFSADHARTWETNWVCDLTRE